MELWHGYAVEVLSGLTLLGVGWVVRGISRVNDHLANLNGKVAEGRTLFQAHERLDDERHANVMAAIKER